jgi:hypothetical protein
MTDFSPLTTSPDSIKNEIFATPLSPPAKVTKTKPRKRVNTAEKRHQHNAIERQRRETLNGKFLSLARLLPSLAAHRRPSKSAIVNGSIAHLTHQRDQRLLAAKLLRKLCAEHDDLLNEVNEWRKANGFAAKDSVTAWTEEVDEVCTVEKEVFGNFATMGGDGDDDDDEMMDNNVSIHNSLSHAQPASLAGDFASLNALTQPRLSRDLDQMTQQTMYGNIPLGPAQPATATATSSATLNGLAWSSDFTFSVGASVPAQTAVADPFSGFMPESFDQSSSTSPNNSLSGSVLTPTGTTDFPGYTHTPSPRSSTSHSNSLSHPLDETKTLSSNTTTLPSQWTAAQLQAFQQHQLQVAQAQAQAPAYVSHLNTHHIPLSNAGGGGRVFGTSPDFELAAQGFGSEHFTQQLLASMFPSNGASPEQVLNWRKAAMGGLMGGNGNGNGNVNGNGNNHASGVQGARGSMGGVSPGHQPTVEELNVSLSHLQNRTALMRSI